MSGCSRRSLLLAGISAARVLAQADKGSTFASDARRYADPVTDAIVYRLTDPAYTSVLPAPYNRTVAGGSAWMLFCCDRTGSPQAFHMDLKTAQTRQLTAAKELDGTSLALTPDNRSFCYFAGRSFYAVALANLRDRELYRVPEGWERCPGMGMEPDGSHIVFAERHGESSRLRLVAVRGGAPRTVLEAPFAISHPIPRPTRSQILYRDAGRALWLVNSDGKQNRQLKTASGQVGPAAWAPDGKTVLYLSFPEDRRQLNTIQELNPEAGTDKLIAKTSQFADLGFNRDTSVFVGASRNVASPTVLLMLRQTRRELTLCEHKSSRPEAVSPRFSPDSQRIFFQSDRDGKPAIYDLHVERLVEKTEEK